jgi:polyisoprenoid-binding protein YceI
VHSADATVAAPLGTDDGLFDVGAGMEDDTFSDRDTNGTRTWIIRGVITVVAVVALVYGAIFLYVTVINDSPDALDEVDLTEAVADTTSTDVSGAGFDGTWVPTTDSAFGYRVEEVIAGVNTTAVGRSNEIDGTLEVTDSTADVAIAVQVESITSDEGRRDSAFRGRIMEADDFPEATFVSTEPIDFGVLPTDGEQVTATATGDLTLKDVTRTVTFEVTAEANGTRIGVLGNIPILFEDYGIENPSFAAVKTESNGLLEFVLVFEPG